MTRAEDGAQIHLAGREHSPHRGWRKLVHGENEEVVEPARLCLKDRCRDGGGSGLEPYAEEDHGPHAILFGEIERAKRRVHDLDRRASDRAS